MRLDVKYWLAERRKGPGEVESPEPETEAENQCTDENEARYNELQEEIWSYADERPKGFWETVYLTVAVARLKHRGAFLAFAEWTLEHAVDVLHAEREANIHNARHYGWRLALEARRAKYVKHAGRWPDPARPGLEFVQKLLASVKDHVDSMGPLENRAYAAATFVRLSKHERAALVAYAEARDNEA